MTTRRERDRLRRLADEYTSITTGAVMDARREVWRRTNRLQECTIWCD